MSSALLVVVFSLAGCRLFLGPEAPIRVEVTLDDITTVGEITSDQWSYTVAVEVNGEEEPVAVGQTVSFDCTTWDWMAFSMRVVDESGLIDRVSSHTSSILGRDILDQSPYGIVRDVEATDPDDGVGSVVWQFEFSLDAEQL
jgi:hypothetical protein